MSKFSTLDRLTDRLLRRPHFVVQGRNITDRETGEKKRIGANNPEQIFLLVRSTLSTTYDASFYPSNRRWEEGTDPRTGKKRRDPISQPQEYAEQAMQIVKLLLEEADELIAAIKATRNFSRDKAAKEAVRSLRDWKAKFPVLVKVLEERSLVLGEIPVVSIYVHKGDIRPHVESPEQAAWRICNQVVEWARVEGNQGSAVLSMVMDLFLEIEEAGLIDAEAGNEFTVAAADPKAALPNLSEMRARIKAAKAAANEPEEDEDDESEFTPEQLTSGDDTPTTLAEVEGAETLQQVKASSKPATKKSRAKKQADGEAPVAAAAS